jgi:hypothetical protein
MDHDESQVGAGNVAASAEVDGVAAFVAPPIRVEQLEACRLCTRQVLAPSSRAAVNASNFNDQGNRL